MAEQEKKVILTVDTGESQRTVKSLKQEISDLKDAILNLEKGSDAYNDAVEQLTTSQRELNEVQALTKKTATALDGSYDALVHTMSQLKKEWRATNDEARRNELGKQIAEINQELKDLDAELGNYQRNVGNYVSHWEGMPDAIGDAGASAKTFQQRMSEMNESIEPTKQKFESVANIASGVAGGFAAVQGAMALLGVENENLEQTFVKLQAAMALAQGIGGMKGLVEGIGRAKVAFEGLGTKIKAVSKTMGKTGWLAVILLVVSAIAALVSWMKKTKEESEEFKATLESTKNLHQQTGGEITKLVGKYQLLQAQFKNLKTEGEKKQWIKENADEFKELGIQIGNVNDAQKAFIENSQMVVEALRLQAEATALKTIYEQAYAEAYEKNKVLDDEIEGIQAGYNPSSAEEEEAGLSALNGDFQTTSTMATSTYGATGTYYTTATPYVTEQGAEKLRQARRNRQNRNNAEVQEIMDDFLAVQQQADAAIKKLEESGIKTTDTVEQTTSTTSSSTKTVIEDVNVTLKKSIQDRIKLEQSASDRKLELLDIERQKEIANAYNTITDETKLQEELERIEREYAGKEYDIEQELLQEKLNILNEWKNANTDAQVERLEIAEEIADTEVEIEKHKQDRLTEIARQGNEDRQQQQTSGTTSTTAQEGLGMIDDFKQQIEDFNDYWKSMNFTQKAAEIGNVVNQSLAGASQIFNQLADMYSDEEELSKEEQKKVKNLRIAGATMDMLSGIVGAISSTAGMGPVGWALGAIQAGIITTTGIMNIQKIKNTDVTGGSTSSLGGGASVTPNIGSYSSELPVNYTRNITTSSEMDELNKEQKVYILESDIQESNKKVSIRESESSF